MSDLDVIAYWLGYSVIVALSLVVIFGGFVAVLTMAAQPALKTLMGMYDLYVLKWWMDAIKKSGRVIPTKNNVAKTLAEIDKDEQND